MSNLNVEQAANQVCRNREHLSQIISLFNLYLSAEDKGTMDVEDMVEYWWKKQLFLSIQLNG